MWQYLSSEMLATAFEMQRVKHRASQCQFSWLPLLPPSPPTSKEFAVNTPVNEPSGYKYRQNQRKKAHHTQLLEAEALLAHQAQPHKVASLYCPSARAWDAQDPAKRAQHIETSAPASCLPYLTKATQTRQKASACSTDESMCATGACGQTGCTLTISHGQTETARCVLLHLDSPIEPMGHGCFATWPCRVRDHIISRASMGSQLSVPAGGSWEEAGGRCVVISSGTSAMGDGVLVLLFLLPEADVVVGRLVLLVAIRGVVLAVVLPGPRAPDVDTPETKAELIQERKEKRDSGLGPKDVLSAPMACGV